MGAYDYWWRVLLQYGTSLESSARQKEKQSLGLIHCYCQWKADNWILLGYHTHRMKCDFDVQLDRPPCSRSYFYTKTDPPNAAGFRSLALDVFALSALGPAAQPFCLVLPTRCTTIWCRAPPAKVSLLSLLGPCDPSPPPCPFSLSLFFFWL